VKRRRYLGAFNGCPVFRIDSTAGAGGALDTGGEDRAA